jgi:hypothetical protein
MKEGIRNAAASRFTAFLPESLEKLLLQAGLLANSVSGGLPIRLRIVAI